MGKIRILEDTDYVLDYFLSIDLDKVTKDEISPSFFCSFMIIKPEDLNSKQRCKYEVVWEKMNFLHILKNPDFDANARFNGDKELVAEDYYYDYDYVFDYFLNLDATKDKINKSFFTSFNLIAKELLNDKQIDKYNKVWEKICELTNKSKLYFISTPLSDIIF